jgi:hypothetical protein
MLHTVGMKRIIMAVTAVALAGGVASAERFHGGGGHSVVVRDHREGGVHVTPSYRGNYRAERPAYYGGYHNYARGPIYVDRPYIRQRYFDYRYRPEVIVENYPARPGYFWVAGQWNWDGYEWQWTPGHYQPDPAYYGY